MFDYREINTDYAKDWPDALLLETMRHIPGELPHGWGNMAELCKRFEARLIRDGIEPMNNPDLEEVDA